MCENFECLYKDTCVAFEVQGIDACCGNIDDDLCVYFECCFCDVPRPCPNAIDNPYPL